MTVTPSASWSRAVSSAPKRISVSPRVSRWRSSTGSRWSWGTAAGVVGLADATCSRSASPSGTTVPSGEASVSVAQALDGQDPGRVDVRAGVGQCLDQRPEPGAGAVVVVVGVVGAVGLGAVLEGPGPGRGAGDQVAHGVSPSRKRLSLAPCAGALTWH